MSILVTGSLAIDHIMVFRDRFRNHILPDRIHMLNVSFFVPTLKRSFGGTAGNIAYYLRQLGADPIVLAAVGTDFGPYAEWLDCHGIRRTWILELPDAHTAQCFITTDLDDNQITAFHAGAMERAHEARLAAVEESIQLGIVSPNGKRAMQEYARELKQRGIPVVVDPGQQIPQFAAEELLELLAGAAVCVVNDYEWSLTLDKTGLSEAELAARVGACIITLGEKGSLLWEGGRRVPIPPVRAQQIVDPTGCGDAYRAGLLWGLAGGRALEESCHLGSLLGSLKVACEGPQGLSLDRAAFFERCERELGSLHS